MGCCSSSVREVGAPRKPADDFTESDDKKLSVRRKEDELAEFVKSGMGRSSTALAVASSEVASGEAASGEARGSARAGLGSTSMSVLNMFTSRASRSAPRDSQFEYASRDQTIIIFDWDDTLLPSSWMRESPLVDEKGHLNALSDVESAVQDQLRTFMDQVVAVLALSLELGKVVVVTNARRPWVDISCRTFLPEARQYMKRIPVLYGLELIEAKTKSFGEDKSVNLTETKVRAMKSAVTKFYSRYDNQSWKNVLSIGDALFEHDAIRQVVRERPGYTTEKKCRTKTIKLLECPSITGLETQLKIVRTWLRSLVESDDDLGIDFGAQALGDQLSSAMPAHGGEYSHGLQDLVELSSR